MRLVIEVLICFEALIWGFRFHSFNFVDSVSPKIVPINSWALGISRPAQFHQDLYKKLNDTRLRMRGKSICASPLGTIE